MRIEIVSLLLAASCAAQPLSTGSILCGAYVGPGGTVVASGGRPGSIGQSLTDSYFDGAGSDGLANTCLGQPGAPANWSCSYSDPSLAAVSGYATLRFGPVLHYRIPVARGFYQGQLVFVEPNKTAAGQRVIGWSINGQSGEAVDIFAMVKADDQPIYEDWLAFASTGFLDITVRGALGNAVLSGISFHQIPSVNLSVFQPTNPDLTQRLVATEGVYVSLLPGFGIVNLAQQPTSNTIVLQQDVNTALIESRAMLQSGAELLCKSTAGNSTQFSCAMSPTLTALSVGMLVRWIPDVAPAPLASLNIDALGAKPVLAADGVSQPQGLAAGRMYQVWYDGAILRLLN